VRRLRAGLRLSNMAAMQASTYTQYVTTESSQTYWDVVSILALYEQPFLDLMHQAQGIHRAHHPANAVQLSSLLSIKTGACSEDCAYCPQSAHHDTGGKQAGLMPVNEVLEAARAAKANGAQRFCMGAAWRSPTARQL